MARLLLVVLAFIVYGSLYPFQFHHRGFVWSPLQILLHSWPGSMDRFMWRDGCVNVLLYFPLGLTATLAGARWAPRVVAAAGAVLLGTGVSACIEMLQLYDSTRMCSLMDVACNMAGAAGGALAAVVFERQIRSAGGHRRASHGCGGGLLLASFWAGYQLYPFIPHLGRTYLRQNAARFLATPISAVEVYASAAEWFAFALILRALDGRGKALWLAFAMCCLPLRLVVMERGLGPSEVLGAVAAMLAWMYPARASRLRAGAVALCAAIVWRELSPFDFVGPAHAMAWLPFSATLDGERLNAALTLLRKVFDYGAVVWLLRGTGVSYARAGEFSAAGLFVLEMAQRYLPGRQPELTDSVIAVAMAGVLLGFENTRRRAGAG